jgi:hypothetical protein
VENKEAYGCNVKIIAIRGIYKLCFTVNFVSASFGQVLTEGSVSLLCRDELDNAHYDSKLPTKTEFSFICEVYFRRTNLC